MVLATVTGQVGCLTVAGIILALVIGRWLDSQFSTASPWFTIGLILGSVPVTLFLMVRLTLRATQSLHTDTKTSPSIEVNNSDDDDNSTET